MISRTPTRLYFESQTSISEKKISRYVLTTIAIQIGFYIDFYKICKRIPKKNIFLEKKLYQKHGPSGRLVLSILLLFDDYVSKVITLNARRRS